MSTPIGRSTVFSIPPQQMWSYGITGDYAPQYYVQSDAPLYYCSFTDAHIALAYRSLPPEQQIRLEPMITGFTTDRYAAGSFASKAVDRPDSAKIYFTSIFQSFRISLYNSFWVHIERPVSAPIRPKEIDRCLRT